MVQKKKDLYFTTKGKKAKIELVEEDEPEMEKITARVRGSKKPIVIQKPEKITKAMKERIRTVKLKEEKPKPTSKALLPKYQKKIEKQETEKVKQLESLKKIQERRRKMEEERYGKPVQLPPEFYKLIESLAPEKLKERDVPSVQAQKEREKAQKEEEEHQEKEKKAKFAELQERAYQKILEDIASKEKIREIEKLDADKKKQMPPPPSYEDIQKIEKLATALEPKDSIAEQKAIDDLKAKNPTLTDADIAQLKKDNVKKYNDLQAKFSSGKITRRLFDFSTLGLGVQNYIINELEQSTDANDYTARQKQVLSNLTQFQKKELDSLPAKTESEIDALTPQELDDFLDANPAIKVRLPQKTRNKKASLKKFYRDRDKAAAVGKGLKLPKAKQTKHSKAFNKYLKSMRGGDISFGDVINFGKKVYEHGKKAYEIGKKIYETGKTVYDTGKKVHEGIKSAHEAFKKFKEKRAQGGMVSAAGLELPKRGRGRPKKAEGGMVSAAGLEGGMVSAAGLEGGAIDPPSVSSGAYSLPLPPPQSARATYQSYF